MKKIAIIIIVLLCASCSLEQATQDNPLGFDDPNTAVVWFQAGQQAAQTGQAVGVATGNPALIAGSTLALLIIGAVGANYIRRNNGD